MTTFLEYEEQALKVNLYRDTIEELFLSLDKTKQYNIDLICSLLYLSSGVNGEAGEIGEKIKKVFRDKKGIINEKDRLLILKEVGDTLWYLAAISKELNSNLSEVAEINLTKINDRIQRDVLSGSGDER